MTISRLCIIFAVICAFLSFSPDTQAIFAREIVLYSFEKDPQGWEVPDWALSKKDHVVRQIGISEYQASSGKYSLEMDAEFSSDPSWAGAYVERLVEVTDWSPFNYLSFDVYLPKDAPQGLKARVILTVGEEWKWTEMNKTVPLAPGEWTVVKVDLTPNSMQWRRFITDAFRSDIRKMGFRVESNGKIAYKGPIYIDNVKLTD